MCSTKLSCLDQSQMQCHLHSCIQNQTMSEFPVVTKPQQLGHTRVKTVRTFNVYCTVMKANMEQKPKHICKEWFHQQCQNIPKEAPASSTARLYHKCSIPKSRPVYIKPVLQKLEKVSSCIFHNKSRLENNTS